MIVLKNRLEEYKEAIRLHYEAEKSKEYSSFLLNPSRALLRKLCVERLKENATSTDLKTFSLFFGFEFENKKKLQSATDKFRPIETFLKRETDLADIEGINMAAILVNYKPRPFAKFKNLNIEFEQENVEVKPVKIEENLSIKRSSKKKIGILVLLIGIVFLVGYSSKKLFFSDDCMQWNGDHYEKVICEEKVQGIGSINKASVFDSSQFNLQKIEVCDTTTFFVGDKAVVWYCKVNGKPEYFTSHGCHPVTGKPLKPITDYIIKKYIEKHE